MDYLVIGDFTIYSDEVSASVVDVHGDTVKSFRGEVAWCDAERWAYDNSPNPHIHG